MVVEVGVCGVLIVLDGVVIVYVFVCVFDIDVGQCLVVFVYWVMLYSDEGVYFDVEFYFDVVEVVFYVIWGMSLDQVIFIIGMILDVMQVLYGIVQVLCYVGLCSGMLFEGLFVQYVFIGLCINVCIEDLCMVVEFVRGCCVVFMLCVMVVFGLGVVKVQVEVEGIV